MTFRSSDPFEFLQPTYLGYKVELWSDDAWGFYSYIGVFEGEEYMVGELFEMLAYDPDLADLDEITLYAVWTTKMYAVYYDSQGGTDVNNSGNIIWYSWFDTGLFPTPNLRGYDLDHWNLDMFGFDNGIFDDDMTLADLMFDDDTERDENDPIILYAIWNARSYTVHLDTQGGTSVNSTNSNEYFWDGIHIIAGNTIKIGYELEGWYTSPNGEGRKVEATDTYGEVSPTEDISYELILYANWIPVGGVAGASIEPASVMSALSIAAAPVVESAVSAQVFSIAESSARSPLVAAKALTIASTDAECESAPAQVAMADFVVPETSQVVTVAAASATTDDVVSQASIAWTVGDSRASSAPFPGAYVSAYAAPAAIAQAARRED